MTEETRKEIIKSMAYGMLDDDVAAIEEMSITEVKAFREENAAAIEAKGKELKEGGWIG